MISARLADQRDARIELEKTDPWRKQVVEILEVCTSLERSQAVQSHVAPLASA